MTSILPALRAKFGSTEYYVATMTVSDLVARIQFPDEVEGWKDMTLQEKFQRKLNGRRVDVIADYFAKEKDRFSGSLVVAVRGGRTLPDMFDLVTDAMSGGGVLKAHEGSTSDMGFLSFESEKLVPLDGQHRAKAFKITCERSGDPDNWNPDVDSNGGTGNDQVSLIMVDFDMNLSRRIFSKINKYAKPTSKADKLITDDDDPMVVITRRLVEGGTIPKRLVNIETNSLTRNACEFTLLSTVYDANKALVSSLNVPLNGKPENMNDKERDLREKEIGTEWKRLIGGISEWKRALKDHGKNGDSVRVRMRKESVACRPIGQLAIVMGYAHACQAIRENGNAVDRDLLVRRLNAVDWRMGSESWRGLLVKPDGKMMYGKRAANKASKLISHLIGTQLTNRDTGEILTFMYGSKSTRKNLPARIKLSTAR